MNKILTFFRKNWIRLIVSLGLGATFLIIYLLAYQNADKVNTWTNPAYYRDGLFLSGMILIFFGGLAICSYFGIFDIFSFYPGRKKKEDGKKENYGDYVERKKLERSSDKSLFFLPYFIVGGLMLIASLILYFALL